MIKHLSLSLLLIPALAYGSTPSAKEQLHEATQARLARLAQQQSDDVALAPIADNNATAAQPLVVEQPSQKTEKQIKKESMRRALFLHVVKHGNLAAVQPWLDHGMDPNMVIADPDYQGTGDLLTRANELPILTHAMLRCRYRGSDDQWKIASPIIKALLARGANPNVASYFRMVGDCYGTWFTPLDLAAYFGRASIIKNLLSAGAHVNGLLGEERSDPDSEALFLMNSPLRKASVGGPSLWHQNQERNRCYWHAMRTLLQAGGTCDWAIGMILNRALTHYAVAREESYLDADLRWQALLLVKNEDLGWLATLSPDSNKAPLIRAGLENLLLNDLINMVIDYTGPSRMRPDVEAEIFQHIPTTQPTANNNNIADEEKSGSGNNNNNTQ